MKAWVVTERNADMGEIHWADSPAKAKMLACLRGEFVNEDGCTYWPDILARRAPEFDGEPRKIDCHEWIRAGYRWADCGWGPECIGCKERDKQDARDGGG